MEEEINRALIVLRQIENDILELKEVIRRIRIKQLKK